MGDANENNWRKCSNFKPLSAVELVLIGDGAGSEWELEWKEGKFPIKFKADGYNHFQCDDFPAHAHWTLEDDKLKIVWGQYGNYEMTVNAAGKSMSGGPLGGDSEKDWRKARFTK